MLSGLNSVQNSGICDPLLQGSVSGLLWLQHLPYVHEFPKLIDAL